MHDDVDIINWNSRHPQERPYMVSLESIKSESSLAVDLVEK
jgi:hypothetical protein